MEADYIFQFTHSKVANSHHVDGTFTHEGLITGRFEATADYVAGEKILINEDEYTPLSTTLEPLPTNAFKTGMIVRFDFDTDTKRIIFPVFSNAEINNHINNGVVHTSLDEKQNTTEHILDISIHTPALTANRTIYVDANNGSDETGDGSDEKPYRTRQYALNSISRNLSGYDVTVIFKNGIYNDKLAINGFYSGKLTMKSQNKWGAIFNANTSCYNISDFEVDGIWFQNINEIALVFSKSNLLLKNSKFTNCKSTTNGIVYCNGVMEAYIYNNVFENNSAPFGCIMAQGCDVKVSSNTGFGNNVAYGAQSGTIVKYEVGNGIGALQKEYKIDGGQIFGDNQINKFKPYFIDEPNITLTGDCSYVKNGNMIFVYGRMDVETINTTSSPEKFLAWRGLPILATTPMIGSQTIGSITEFSNIYTYCVFTGVDIDLRIVDYNTHICRPLAIKDIKVGTAINIHGFYFIEE